MPRGSRRTLIAVLGGAALALLGACASGPPGRGLGGAFESGWARGETTPHPALREGVELTRWTRGRGAETEVAHSFAVAGEERAADDAEALALHARPPRDAPSALHYVDLWHRVFPASGTPLAGDPHARGRGSSGRYTADDAQAWGVALEPSVRPWGGGHEVTHVLLLDPVAHRLLSGASPFRVVERRELVHADGTVSVVEERTLTNGDDAARYALR